MVWRIGLVGVLATLLAGCLAPPPPGGAGDASPIDAAVDGDGQDADDRPDVPALAPDVGMEDRPSIDLLSDPNNCGALGMRCSNGLGGPGRCVDGRCACTGSRASCGSPFNCPIDLDTDNAHCGRCDRACPIDKRCVGGACLPCPEGFATCNPTSRTRCSVSLDTYLNCGVCDRRCANTERCVDGSCHPLCPMGLTPCAGSMCLDLQGDSANCGRCGQRCGMNETCTLGRCTEVPCPVAGERHCDPTSTRCIPVLDDPQNCGACGAQCLDTHTSTAVCAGGACARTCRPGFASCGADTSCSTELAFDDDHCGGCDVRCGALSHCIGGVCTSLAARPVAPLSTIILGVQRPRFRWQRAAGVDGVRLQICADRGCTRVESTRDLTGDEHRPELALTPGVHFWRLFARRDGVVSASPSPVWEFVVPAVDTGREVVGFLHDIDGDGVEDGFEGRGIRHSLAPGDSQPLPLAPELMSDDVPPGTFSEQVALELGGDIDGDGFGDLIGSHIEMWGRGDSGVVWRQCTAIRGGPRFASSFNDVAVGLGGAFCCGYDRTSCNFVFDLNGDGYGDIESKVQHSSASSIDEVRFGGQNRWTTPAAPDLWGPTSLYTHTTWGDFNGDGRMDLLHTNNNIAGDLLAGIQVASFARGADSAEYFYLPGCPAAAAGGALNPIVTTTIRVLDANGDGFDDLRVTPYPSGIATYLGGPGGFASERCLYSPAPP